MVNIWRWLVVVVAIFFGFRVCIGSSSMHSEVPTAVCMYTYQNDSTKQRIYFYFYWSFSSNITRDKRQNVNLYFFSFAWKIFGSLPVFQLGFQSIAGAQIILLLLDRQLWFQGSNQWHKWRSFQFPFDGVLVCVCCGVAGQWLGVVFFDWCVVCTKNASVNKKWLTRSCRTIAKHWTRYLPR